MSALHVDKIAMQNRLFAELSAMFGREVPLYDKSLLVNRACNRAVCDLLGQAYVGFTLDEAQLDRTSGERHGAIRIGTPAEYRWVARYFAAFALEPHNYYDMSSVGAKSQPIVATAFRSVIRPEHRVFTSLLMTDYFDPATKGRIEALLAGRAVFSARAKELIERSERQGGLDRADADALIHEGVESIFRWHGRARDHALYKELCDAGFKIAADIACFGSHHLNHLTPNTFCIDLYTTAMKFRLGEMDEATFRARAEAILRRLLTRADRDWMRLHFRHLTAAQIDGYRPARPAPDAPARSATALAARLQQPDLSLDGLKHAGFKEFTEGPAEGVPLLLRQDSYKALTEPVEFHGADGTKTPSSHTARFGEIEERFYATTPAGRDLYDRCLAAADAERDGDPGLAKRDPAAYDALCARHFAAFPKTLRELLEQGLVHGCYAATHQGRAAARAGTVPTDDIHELVRLGLADVEGIRYEDFLPVSAAGIFASNLSQYGTKSTAAVKPTYTQPMLEAVLGRPIVDAGVVYRGLEAQSLLATYSDLGLLESLPAATRRTLEQAVAACPAGAVDPAPIAHEPAVA